MMLALLTFNIWDVMKAVNNDTNQSIIFVMNRTSGSFFFIVHYKQICLAGSPPLFAVLQQITWCNAREPF